MLKNKERIKVLDTEERIKADVTSLAVTTKAIKCPMEHLILFCKRLWILNPPSNKLYSERTNSYIYDYLSPEEVINIITLYCISEISGDGYSTDDFVDETMRKFNVAIIKLHASKVNHWWEEALNFIYKGE